MVFCCFIIQVEEVTPPGVRPHFQHQHEWDGCPLVAKAADNQVLPSSRHSSPFPS